MIQKHITILFSLVFGLVITCKGQKIQVIRLEQCVSPTEKIEVFDLIEKEVDTTRIQYIATLRSVGADKNATIQELYYALKRKSNFFGANGFRILEYNASKGTLLADVYYLTDTLFKENLSYHEKNFIYIFCREKVSDKKYNFKINGEKKFIHGGEYFRMANLMSTKINKGGVLGATVWIEENQGRPSTFLAMDGFKIFDPMASSPRYNNSSAIAISTGGLSYIEGGLGRILLRYLKPVE